MSFANIKPAIDWAPIKRAARSSTVATASRERRMKSSDPHVSFLASVAVPGMSGSRLNQRIASANSVVSPLEVANEQPE